MMQHPDLVVQEALVRLTDALCQWERATGRQSVLILKEDGGFKYRALNGKPDVPEDIDDMLFLDIVR